MAENTNPSQSTPAKSFTGYRFDSNDRYKSNGNTLTNVNIMGIADKALNGIMTALNEQAKSLYKLQTGIETLEETTRHGNEVDEQTGNAEKKRRESDLQRSVASERRQRAANAAIFGKVDKAMTLLETLQKSLTSLFKNVLDQLKGAFKNALNAFDSLSASMRKQNISHQDKLMVQELSSNARVLSAGLRESKTDINAALEGLAKENNSFFQKLVNDQKNGTDAEKNAADMRINLMAEMKKQGYSDSDIAKIITQIKDNQLDSFKNTLLKTSDPTGGGFARAAISEAINNNFENFNGDVAAGLESIADGARDLARSGAGFSERSYTAISQLGQAMSSGNLQNVNESVLKSVLGVSGSQLNNTDAVVKGINDKLFTIDKLVKEGKSDEAQALTDEMSKNLKILSKAGVDEQLIGEMQRAVNMAANGNLNAAGLKSIAELEEMNKDNTTNGKLQAGIDWLSDGFNSLTAAMGIDGGLIGKISTNLDEVFGGNVSTGDVVADGFTNVLSVLKSIRFTLLAQSITNFIKSPIGIKILEAIGLGGLAAKFKADSAKNADGTKQPTADKPGSPSAEHNGKMPTTPDAKTARANGIKAHGKAALYGLGAAGLIALLTAPSEASAAELQNQHEVLSEMQESVAASGDFYSDMLSLVSDIRDALCNGQTHHGTGFNSHEDMLLSDIPQEVYLANMGLGLLTENPLDKFASERVANTKLAKSLNSFYSETGGMAKDFAREKFSAYGKFASPAIHLQETSAFNKAMSAASKVADSAAFRTATKSLKTVGKALGPVGMALDVGLTGFDVARYASGADQMEAIGKDLSKELYRKQAALKKAQSSGDTNAARQIESEIESIESALSEVAMKQEQNEDAAIKAGVKGATNLAAVAAGAAVGQALIPIPFLGAAIGGAVAGYIGNELSDKLADAALEERTEEEKQAKIREKREKYAEELHNREQAALNKGLSDDIASALVINAETEDIFQQKLESIVKLQEHGFSDTIMTAFAESALPQEELNSKIDGLIQMQKLGFNDEELSILANNANDTEEMRAIAKKVLSDPSRIYSNIGSIAVDISAMRTNLMSVYDRVNEIEDGLKSTLKFADGGIVTSATPAVVGEDGKEAIIPLEKPNEMKKVLSNLSASEKLALIKELISNRRGVTWGLISSALLNVLGIGQTTSGKPLSSEKVDETELSRRIIAGAAAQKGHSYTEMVCNQMVEAALKYAGFNPPTTGVVTKHFNHPNMHLVLNDPVKGISPNDPALLPGMIMFSHPFTQAEADQLNRQKGGKRKAGDPGHMGIYAGDGLWWNSTSSKKFKDYSTGKAIDSTASGVALTKPFTTGTYKLYAAGYYDGMFGASAASLPSAPIPSYNDVKKAGLLSDAELKELADQAGVANAATMAEFVKQAEILLNSGKDKDSIIAILLDIAKYLRGAVASTKQPMMSVARPAMSTYG